MANVQLLSADLLRQCPSSAILQHRSVAYAGAIYEQGLFNAHQRSVHHGNRARIETVLDALYQTGEQTALGSLRAKLGPILMRMVSSGQLDLRAYGPKVSGQPGGYSKNLLYVSKDPSQPWCLQLFAFEPGQQTPVHDHPCECWSVVVQGALCEALYTADATTGKVREDMQRVRNKGSVEEFVHGHLDIPHRLYNPSSAVDCTWTIQNEQVRFSLKANRTLAISIHLYAGMDGGGGESREVSDLRPNGAHNPLVGLGAVKRVYTV